jgi:ankyrin repeat protein
MSVSLEKLRHAVKHGKLEDVQFLLTHRPSLLNQGLNKNDETALYIACYSDPAIVKLLLEKYIDLFVNKAEKVRQFIL